MAGPCFDCLKLTNLNNGPIFFVVVREQKQICRKKMMIYFAENGRLGHNSSNRLTVHVRSGHHIVANGVFLLTFSFFKQAPPPPPHPEVARSETAKVG